MKTLAFLILVAGCSSKSSPSPENLGLIDLESQSYSQGGTIYGSGSVTASFLRSQIDPYLGCKKKSFGACTARFDCQPVLSGGSDDGGASPYGSAGDLTVGGLAMPITLMVMTAGTFPGQYSSFEQYTPLFMGGEKLTVAAAGAEVGAFNAEVTAPTQPTITAPDATLPATVAHGQDLDFVWSGGNDGVLRVALTQQSTSGAPGIDCSFSAAGGAGKVPSEALGLFAAGTAAIDLVVASSSELTVGDWHVQLAATTAPLQPGGAGYALGYVNLQ